MFRLIITLIIFLSGITGVSNAQEIVTTGDISTGARSMGMGGTQIASGNDVTAAFNNPAALARINTLQFQLGIDLLRRETN
jgi:hypothetical protein